MGGSLTFVALASLAAISSIGVGGNIPVDSAVFLGLLILCLFNHVRNINACTDFIPASHQYVLTFMSIWWTFGQLFASLVCVSLFSAIPSNSLSLLGCLAAHRKLLMRANWPMLALRQHGLALFCYHTRGGYAAIFLCARIRIPYA
jgi:hypothetical protein